MGALSHMSTHKYIHASVHVALSQLGHVTVLHHYSNNLQGTRGNILSRPFVPLSCPHPPDSLKSSLICEPWLADTRLTDETLPILTSTSVDRHDKSQVTSKVEKTTSYVMTHRLTQPQPSCKYDDCLVTIAQSSLQWPSQHY